MTTQPDPPGLESYGWDDEWAPTYAAALAAMAGAGVGGPRPGRVGAVFQDRTKAALDPAG